MNVNKKGFTIIEIILIFIVVTTILMSVFIIYPKIQMTQRLKTASGSLSLIKNAIDINNSVSSNLTWLTTENIIKMKVLPPSMIRDNKIINPWGGEIEVSTLLHQYFLIEYSHVPVSDCVKFISSVSSVNDNVYQVRGSRWNIKIDKNNNTDLYNEFCTYSLNLDNGGETISFAFSDFDGEQ
ncbi:type 4 pilus major pilin [Trabulsiella odontotermitis]|uniref:type 4 pilus major pilin n=1 Tax=Trabulsiella odontotermitis TaxID=379893 RepID=UPI0006BA3F36|nr:type 4 pilus major pilin [Trabulsiella odontotermitis]